MGTGSRRRPVNFRGQMGKGRVVAVEPYPRRYFQVPWKTEATVE